MQHTITTALTAAILGASALAAPMVAQASDKKIPKKARYDYVLNHVDVEVDEFLGARTATGPEIRFKPEERNYWTDGYVFYRLSAFDVGRTDNDGNAFTEIQLRMKQSTLGDWQGYNAAFTKGGELSFRKIDAKVDCTGASCTKIEAFAIDMTADQLKLVAEAETFTFKVYGTGQSVIVDVPNSYINGFLDALAKIDE